MLKGEGGVVSAKLRPLPCLIAEPQLLQLSVLEQARYHDAGIEPADGLAD